MHRFSSVHALRRFRLAMLLLLAKCLLTPVAAGVLLYALVMQQQQPNLLMIGAWLAGAAVLAAILQWIFANRANCPLCLTSVLASRGCMKHRNSRKLFGSYRLRVALSAFFRGYFRCPYCNEPTSLEVRERNKRRGKKQQYHI
jgi:hypothetical protein